MADDGYVEESGGTGEFDDGSGKPKGKQTPEEQAQSEAEAAIVKECVDFVAFVEEVDGEQRKREEEELYFEAVDQWTDEARDARSEHDDPETGMAVQAKPTILVNLLDQPIQERMSEARGAQLAVSVKPKGKIANTKQSDYMKGLLRTIQVDSGAQDGRYWALERATRVGRGGYQIRADYANDGDFDIDLIPERILDQSLIFWDPYARRSDYGDQTKNVVAQWMSVEDRKRKYPNKPWSPPTGVLGADNKFWYVIDDSGEYKSVLIATFQRTVYGKKQIGYHPLAGLKPLEQHAPAHQAEITANAPGTRLRDVETRTVEQYTTDGTQILEPMTTWLGRFIPVIPTIGKEYFVKGKRIWKGMVSNAQDISRAINVVLSAATQIAAEMPHVPYIMAEGQDRGHEQMWDDAAVTNTTRLYYNPKSVDGQLVPAPMRQSYELEIQGLMFLLRMLIDMFHSAVGSVPPTSRAVNPYDRSGKAIEALQRQGQAGSACYLDNLATISMMQEGRVLVDAIPKYYDTPGRILNCMGEENDDETAIMIRKPFVRDDEGNPIVVPCPTCQGQKTIPGGFFRPAKPCPTCLGTGEATRDNAPPFYQDQQVEYVDFADAQYKVVVDIEKGYAQKQDEALAGLTELAKAAPELVPTYADLWVRAMGFSGSGAVADRLQAQNPAAPGDTDKVMKNLPPSVMAAFQKLKMEHDQAMQAIKQAQSIIQGKRLEGADKKTIAMLQEATKERIENLRLQAVQLKTASDAKKDAGLTVMKGHIQKVLAESQQQHEIVMQLLKELGAKEVERHSVGLHAEASRIAADQMASIEDKAALRDSSLTAAADTRKAAFGDVLGLRGDTRKAAIDDHQAGRDAAIQKDQATHTASLADQAAQRDASLGDQAATRDAAIASDAREHEADLAPTDTEDDGA